ncbi:hypothetical protein HRbin02_01134 [Candidatus Calditenuaceae archaeon HR02]|nr:hypothetical protein HRbin02_01134 [Candidatus Calditenuaceae archaeon HR02]
MTLKRVTVALKVPLTAWARDIVGCGVKSISILDCIQNDDGSITHLFLIKTGNSMTSSKVMSILKKSMNVDEIVFVRPNKPNSSVSGLVRSSKCDLCGVVAKRCLMKRGEYRVKEGKLFWTFVATDREVPKILEALRERGEEAELTECVELEGHSEILSPQLNVIMRTLEMGYFDVPRKVSIREAAREFGLSPASLSVMIRRGVRRMVRSYIATQGYLS